MDVDAYFARIGYVGQRRPEAATLHILHLAHLLTTPFENLDILARRPIVLDEAALFDKIVRRRRGGVCYELNGLFAALLQALGFTVHLLAARDIHADGTLGPAFDHLTLLVEAEERWLADVGWGDQFVRPLRLDERGEQSDGRRVYRINDDGAGRVVACRLESGAWEPMYCFDLQTYALDDFGPMCLYHQTPPDGPFTQRRLCTRLTEEGRVTLSESRLVVTDGKGRQERELAGEADVEAVLRECFGIVPDGMSHTDCM
jgi:N-hydroxyarylamine O-acetyltransferase